MDRLSYRRLSMYQISKVHILHSLGPLRFRIISFVARWWGRNSIVFGAINVGLPTSMSYCCYGGYLCDMLSSAFIILDPLSNPLYRMFPWLFADIPPSVVISAPPCSSRISVCRLEIRQISIVWFRSMSGRPSALMSLDRVMTRNELLSTPDTIVQ